MAYGKILTMVKAANGAKSGTLSDIDTGKEFPFKDEMNIKGVNVPDIVNYTDTNGSATMLTPNLNIRTDNLESSSKDVLAAFDALTKAMAQDKNNCLIAIKKV